MGVIRTLLALAVVITHSHSLFGFYIIPASHAVQSFYIISGFYMSLILNEKYSHKSYNLFMSNRILRLYPLYYVIFLITVIISLLYGLITNNYLSLSNYITYYKVMSFCSFLFLIIVNILIIGQDWVLFMGLNSTTGGLFFTDKFYNTIPQLASFLIVPQAWSLGIEMVFYSIAPFIVTRYLPIIGILFISFLVRIYFYTQGYWHDPWTYRFFPFELFCFLSGALCYQAYKIVKKIRINQILNYCLLLFIIGYILFYDILPTRSLIKAAIFYGALCVALPFIFNFTKYNKIDRTIGELSYPIYLVHFFIVTLYSLIIPKTYLAPLVIITSVFISYLLIRFISRPIDSYRERRVTAQ